MPINYDVEYPKLQRRLRMADTVNRDLSESYEKRIAELDTENKRLKNRGTITSPMDGLFEENERLKAKLDAVLKTEVDWYDGPLFVRQLDAVEKTLAALQEQK